MKVYITFAASMLIDVSAAVVSAPLTKKETGGIMMRALQAQYQECEAEGTALGLCLGSAGVTDYEEIKACAFCPLDAIINTGFDDCSSSDVDSFYAFVQSCGVEACHTTCRDELQAGAECVVKGACPYAESYDAATGGETGGDAGYDAAKGGDNVSNDAAKGGGFATGFGGFAFICSFASISYAVGGIM